VSGFKDHLPPSAVGLFRLLRTRLTLGGVIDPAESAARRDAANGLSHLGRSPGRGERVLIFSLRGGWYPHTAWDTLIGSALMSRGAAVHVFNCGGLMPICEVNFRRASPQIACSECAAYPAALGRQVDLPRSWLRDYVTPEDRDEISRTVDALDPAAYRSWIFDGQPVGELVRNSVLWFLRKTRIESGPDSSVYRDFLMAGALIARLAPRLLAATKPEIVLEVNGRFFAEQVFNRFVPAGCRLITYEAGWRSNSLGFDDFSEQGFADLDAAWAEVRPRALTEAESLRLDDWIKTRGRGDMQRDFYVRFDTAKSGNPIAELGLDAGLPTAVLFTNLVWDTAVLGKDRAFRSIEHWLRDTVDWFRRNPDRQLVIRIHPAEDLRPSQESQEKVGDIVRSLDLPGNVRVVPSRLRLSSYRLIDAAATVLVYNSTPGMEAALRGRRVVVAASVYYAGRGFTTDVEDVEDYAATLERAFTSGPLDPPAAETARRFAYLLLFRFLHDVPVVKQRPGTFPLLSAAEVPLAAPGSGDDFDRLMYRILRGEPLVTLAPSR